MRLVICDGIQYDADNLPAHVAAERCVPADEWFRQNRKGAPAPAPRATPPVEADGSKAQAKRRPRRTSN